jgi:UDP-glucuronate 4-epimerase
VRRGRRLNEESDLKILVTGAAGFIGMHVSQLLLARGDEVVGLDNLNDYYDPALKRARLAMLERQPGFRFVLADLSDSAAVEAVFQAEPPEQVVHLGAQVGVRYSVKNPRAYLEANLVGFFNVLDPCARRGVKHLVYASSSSVYGANPKVPFSESDNVDHPISLYAATKKANELMAHSYSHLNGLPTTGLRFFTVYGPWGRPDMAPMLFARAILRGEPITVYNDGRMRRDFTYVDDIVEVVVRALACPPVAGAEGAATSAPYRVLNAGNNSPVELMEFIALLERHLGKAALKTFAPMQPGDVPATWADTEAVERTVGFAPATPLDEGLRRFAEWVKGWEGGAR